jgi:osmotically-inducible protein OsmY
LIWSLCVDATQGGVSVLEGIALLTGAVDSWGEYRAAQENAFEGGVISVVNKLKVK